MRTISHRSSPRSPLRLSQDAAESLTLRAIAWLATDDGRLARLLALSGATPDDLRSRIHDPAFLAGVLDMILSDEPMLLDLAASLELDPQTLVVARYALPGAPVE